MERIVTLTELPKLARAIIRKLRGGDVLTLSGDLASGKTTLTKALVSELGYTGRVASPSFVLERRYPLKSKKIDEVIHLDLYRLNKDQLSSFDWRDHLGQARSLTIIEWPEIAVDHLPTGTKHIKLEIVDDQTRRLTFSENINL